MRYIILILLLVLAALLVLFGVQNPQPVTVKFMSYEAGNLSLSLVVIIAAIVGAALVGLLSLSGSVQRGLRTRRDNKIRTTLEARNRELERELQSLRGSVVKEPAAPKK